MSKTSFVDVCQGLALASYKGLQATDRTLMHGRIGHLIEAHIVKIILILGAILGLLHHMFRDSLSRAGVSCLVLAGIISFLNVFFLNNSSEFQKNERVFLSRAKKLTLLFLCSFLFLFCVFCTAGGFFGFSALHVRQHQPAVIDFVRQPAPLNSASIVTKEDEDANQNLVYVDSPKPAVKSAAEKLRDKVKQAEKEETPVEEVARASIDTPVDPDNEKEPEKESDKEKPAMAGATILAAEESDSNPELGVASVQSGGETFVSVTTLPAGVHSPAAAAAIESSKISASISAADAAVDDEDNNAETKKQTKEETAVAEINGGAPASADHPAAKGEKGVASIASPDNLATQSSAQGDFKLNGGIQGGAAAGVPPTEVEVAIAAIQGGSESENTPSSAAAAIGAAPHEHSAPSSSKKKPAPTHVEVETETDPAIAHPSRPTPAASSSVLPAAATRDAPIDPLEHAVPDRTLALADDEDSKNDLAEFERQRKELMNQLKQKLAKSRIGKQQKEQIRSQSNWHSNAVPTDSAEPAPVAAAAAVVAEFSATPEDHSQMLAATQAHVDVDARLRAALQKHDTRGPVESDASVHSRQHSHEPRKFQPAHSEPVKVADANVADEPAEEVPHAVPARARSKQQAPAQHKQQQKKMQHHSNPVAQHAPAQPHHQQAHQKKAKKHSKAASASSPHVESQPRRARKQINSATPVSKNSKPQL